MMRNRNDVNGQIDEIPSIGSSFDSHSCFTDSHSYIKCSNSVLSHVLKVLMILCSTIILACGLHFFCRIFIADRFSIPTQSMQPTLVPGDYVWVNKLIIGARLYKSFDFENRNLNCIRMPGIRNIQLGDVICFNFPYGYDNLDRIEFRINNVYCKRVLGTPGDRIGVVDGHYWNDRNLKPIGVLQEQERLRWEYDSVFIWHGNYYVFPSAYTNWTIKNWGPLVVPQKGLSIELNDSTRELYRKVIEYEMGNSLSDKMVSYTFLNNWYFAVGDNASYSYDSRYWGFIPEEFIIGIVGGSKVRNNPYKIYPSNAMQ